MSPVNVFPVRIDVSTFKADPRPQEVLLRFQITRTGDFASLRTKSPRIEEARLLYTPDISSEPIVRFKGSQTYHLGENLVFMECLYSPLDVKKIHNDTVYLHLMISEQDRIEIENPRILFSPSLRCEEEYSPSVSSDTQSYVKRGLGLNYLLVVILILTLLFLMILSIKLFNLEK